MDQLREDRDREMQGFWPGMLVSFPTDTRQRKTKSAILLDRSSWFDLNPASQQRDSAILCLFPAQGAQTQ